MQGTKITTSQLVEARKDAPKMLDFADETLNQMPFPIAPLVIFTRLFGIFVGRNDRFNPSRQERVQKMLRAIASIGNQVIKLQVNDQMK